MIQLYLLRVLNIVHLKNLIKNIRVMRICLKSHPNMSYQIVYESTYIHCFKTCLRLF